MFGFINPQATAVSDPVTNIRGCGPERLHRTTHMKGTSEFTSAGFPFRPGPHSGSNHLHFSLLLGFSTVHPLPSFLLNLTSPCTYMAHTFFFNLSLPYLLPFGSHSLFLKQSSALMPGRGDRTVIKATTASPAPSAVWPVLQCTLACPRVRPHCKHCSGGASPRR